MELPKHTTQVGTIPTNKKLYLEDYCISYKKQLDDLYPGERKQIALFGTLQKEKNVEYAFAYGAALLGKGKGRTDSLTAVQKEEAENLRHQYFSEYQLIGLVIASDGVEEMFYWLGSGSKAIPIDGYYIFYDQNEAMLNYMMENQKEERAIDMDPVIAKKADMDRERKERKEREERERLEAKQLTGSYRKRIKEVERAEERQKNKNHFSVAAGFALVAIVGIYGLRAYYPNVNLDTIKAIVSDWMGKASVQTGGFLNDETSEFSLVEENLSTEGATDIEETGIPVASKEPPEVADLDVVVIPDLDALAQGDGSMQVSATTTEAAAQSEEDSAILEQEAAGLEDTKMDTEEKPAEPVAYLIKRGDNLLRILRAHYGDESKLQEICVVNNIKDPNNIQVGQTILLP